MNTTLVNGIRGHVLSICKPEMIMIFGSYTQNRANKFSDIDLLVVCQYVNKRPMLERSIKLLSKKYGIKTDVLVRSTTETFSAFNTPNSFLGSVLKKGTVIYKKDGFNLPN